MSDIEKATKLLIEGKIVAIPTETVYGLAANALNENAVTNIFKVKNRPHFDPLIIHISGIQEVEKYAKSFPDKAKKLAQHFWPGPLTIILPKKNIVPDLVTSGLQFVGLRVPNHKLTLSLLNKLPFPLAAPSANPFGYVSPSNAQHVKNQLGYKIDYILDGGPCSIGLESSIIKFDENSEASILRLGGLSVKEIENIIGPIKLNIASHSKPNSPGQLDKHYATNTPIKYKSSVNLNELDINKTATLLFSKMLDGIPESNQFLLSKDGSLDEAARNLFSTMRHIDSKGFKLILTEIFPKKGLGPAINDRLKRAVHN